MIKDSSFSPPADADEKYRNEDYIMKMLVARNPEELQNIKRVQNLSDEQIVLFCDFAQLRAATLGKIKEELARRKADNPGASREELAMGAYLEQIEPQIREAVLVLRRKGYTTYESGFTGFDSQKIGFEKEHLQNWAAPEKLQAELGEESAELIISPRFLEIKFSRFIGLEKIGEMWKKIANALPALGKEAEPARIGSAKMFRERQRTMRDAAS